MTMEAGLEALEAIRGSSEEDLAREVIARAVRYARIRVDWALASPADRAAMDRSRTAAHDAFIDSLNILSRAMRGSGEDNSWRARLGDDRKLLGDFACHVHLLLGLRAR